MNQVSLDRLWHQLERNLVVLLARRDDPLVKDKIRFVITTKTEPNSDRPWFINSAEVDAYSKKLIFSLKFTTILAGPVGHLQGPLFPRLESVKAIDNDPLMTDNLRTIAKEAKQIEFLVQELNRKSPGFAPMVWPPQEKNILAGLTESRNLTDGLGKA